MSKLDDFVSTVEAVNDGQLTARDMHDAYSNSSGYLDSDTLDRLIYFAQQVQEAIHLAEARRAAE